MSFKFSLQRLLQLRDQQVLEAEHIVEKTRSAIAELKKLLNQERDLYFSERNELNSLMQSSYLDKISLYDKSLGIRQNRMMELLDNLRSLQVDFEMYQQNLIQAKRNLKILENVKENRQEEYQKNVSYKEQLELDEMGIQRFLRMQAQEKGDE